MRTARKLQERPFCPLCLGLGRVWYIMCQTCHTNHYLSPQARFAVCVTLPCGHVAAWHTASVEVCPDCQGSGVLQESGECGA